MPKVVQVPKFTASINLLTDEFSRLPEAIAEVEKTLGLCESLEIFPKVIGMELQRIKLTAFPNVPPLSIFFRVDNDGVYLLFAELIDGDE